jgi:hypothetical protein
LEALVPRYNFLDLDLLPKRGCATHRETSSCKASRYAQLFGWSICKCSSFCNDDPAPRSL